MARLRVDGGDQRLGGLHVERSGAKRDVETRPRARFNSTWASHGRVRPCRWAAGSEMIASPAAAQGWLPGRSVTTSTTAPRQDRIGILLSMNHAYGSLYHNSKGARKHSQGHLETASERISPR